MGCPIATSKSERSSSSESSLPGIIHPVHLREERVRYHISLLLIPLPLTPLFKKQGMGDVPFEEILLQALSLNMSPNGLYMLPDLPRATWGPKGDGVHDFLYGPPHPIYTLSCTLMKKMGGEGGEEDPLLLPGESLGPG